MIDCPNVEMRDRLPDLVNESLDPGARVLVLAHLEECAACAAEIEILRSARLVLIQSTPRVNVAAIVAALPQPGVISIGSARSARRASWGAWRAAAAITVFAAGIGSYAVLRPDSPIRSVDSTQLAPAASDSSGGLALTGTLADLSDAELDALVKDIDGIEALPSAEVDAPSSAITMPALIPDSVFPEEIE